MSSTTHTSTAELTPTASRDDSLAQSQQFCADLTRAQAKNFYYGMMLTPQPKRGAMYAIYAWMRAVDDIADEPGALDDKTRDLEAFRRQTHAVLREDSADYAPLFDGPYGAMWPAVGQTFRRYSIPQRYLDAMIDGQLLDQTKTRYATFDELYDYCFKVASVVGLICLEVWGYTGGEATRKLAEQRGIALQLTNIIRDLVEDARRDRIYFPQDELVKAGLDDQRFKAMLESPLAPGSAGGTPVKPRIAGGANIPPVEPGADGLPLGPLIARARGYYDSSATLESFITPDCRPTCWAMMKIYEGLLRKIERKPLRVLTERVRLSKLEKMFIALRATWRRWLRR